MGRITAFGYMGGKNKNSHKIIEHLPYTSIYIEPFLGSGGIFLNKRPRSKTNIINDVDGHIVNFFRVLRTHPEELARAIVLTPNAREEYMEVCKMDSEDPIEHARQFYCYISQSMVKSTNLCDTSFARINFVITDLQSEYTRLLRVANAVKPACVENMDAVKLISSYKNREDVLCYCDPLMCRKAVLTAPMETR